MILSGLETNIGRAFRALLPATALLLVGCGGKAQTYPVTGKVVYSDGTPIAKGLIEFQHTLSDGKRVNARGVIDEQGTFVLETFADADGALAGEHQAIVFAAPREPSGDITKLVPEKGIAERFQKYETSGLKFIVEPQANEFMVTVEREP